MGGPSMGHLNRGGWREAMRGWLATPTDPFLAERVAIARRVEQICVVALLGLMALLPLRSEATWVDWTLYPAVGLLLAAMYVLRPRFPAAAGFVGGVGFMGLVTAAAWFRDGLGSGVTSGAYALAVVVGGLLWGPGKTLLLAPLASGGAALLAWYAPTPAAAPLRSWAELTAILFTLGLFVELLLSALGERITEARTTRKRFQQLFDGSPDALIVLDKRGLVQLMNRAARALVGVDVPSGTPLAALPHFQGENVSLISTVTGTDLDTGIQRIPGLASLESPLSLAPGRYHELTVSPLTGTGRELKDSVLLTVRDVTERVEAAQARREFEAQLAKSKSLEALGRLAGGVAHDFNNLLTVIIGTTDLLLETPSLDAQIRFDLNGIKYSAGQAAELTSQLLAFGRKQILEPSVFCPTDSLFQLQPMLHRLLPSNITLLLDPAHSLGHVRIDPSRLDQILINLVTNACDSMPGGGTLTIATRNVDSTSTSRAALAGGERETIAPGSYVSLTVTDTGSGMTEETLARIFEPFFTTKGLGKGTGLGLATVFGIVRQSGGYIRVETKPERGTRFELLFPRVDPGGHAFPKPRTKDSALLGSLRVLLVDDNAAVRASVSQMLEASGHRVTTATDLAQAALCAQVPGTRFDLLITDVMMPGAHGAQLASTLLHLQPQMRVLFVTGHSELPLEADLPALPPSSLARLSKPFTKRVLDDKLRELFVAIDEHVE
jgi:two-component system, cell cycle sensor histidine kinase and response regulator CckA